MKVERALISVSDKTGLAELVKGLHELNIEILSTGGTAKLIQGMGIPVVLVSDYTGFPEMLDGRVKTLHPKIHGGLLARRDNPGHLKEAEEHGIKMIDLVVVNLYPFEKTVLKPDVSIEEAVENIDIGGPSMLRSAAKNFSGVAVVCNPARYPEILKELREKGRSISDATRVGLAEEAFSHTARYDSMIYDYFQRIITPGISGKKAPAFPDRFIPAYEKAHDLRYGENPHQKAAFYRDVRVTEPCVSTAAQLQGKELSFNNILDLDAAIEAVKEFTEPAACLIKHTNPCGFAISGNLTSAFRQALKCDPLSAFGCIVGLNTEVDETTARAIISSGFVECVIAPGYAKEAIDFFKNKKNVRVLKVEGWDNREKGVSKYSSEKFDIKKVVGGVLVQDIDGEEIEATDLKVVTKKRPTKPQLKSLLFGWKVVRHVKSNAIVLSQGTRTVGIGAGQMSRVDSVEIAVRKAGKNARGATLASDAFFPKPDGIQKAARAGITAIIQPGGSIADEEIIKTADKAGITMLFTGMRHFKH